MDLLETAWALFQRQFHFILSIFWISWWIAVALCLILVTLSRYLSMSKMARFGRGRTGQTTYGGDRKDIFDLSPEQLKSLLERRQKELLADIERMGLDFEARAVLENFRQIIKRKLNDIDATYEELKTKLLGVHRALDNFQGTFPPQQLLQAQKALGRGETARAEGLFKQGLVMGKKLIGETPGSKLMQAQGTEQAAAASYHLGILAESQADYILAAQYYHQAAELQPTNLAYLSAAGIFAYSLWQYHEAEKLLKSTLNIQERLLGPEHPELAKTLNNLGALYHSQGRFKQAEALYSWALEIYEPRFSPKHPDVLTLLENYTALLNERGRPDEAVSLKARIFANSDSPNHGEGTPLYLQKSRA